MSKIGQNVAFLVNLGYFQSPKMVKRGVLGQKNMIDYEIAYFVLVISEENLKYSYQCDHQSNFKFCNFQKLTGQNVPPGPPRVLRKKKVSIFLV